MFYTESAQVPTYLMVFQNRRRPPKLRCIVWVLCLIPFLGLGFLSNMERNYRHYFTLEIHNWTEEASSKTSPPVLVLIRKYSGHKRLLGSLLPSDNTTKP